MGRAARMVAAMHGLIAMAHVYWATGASWPAADQRELSYAVLGGEVSFAPRVVLPLAAFHLLAAAAVLSAARPGRTRTIARLVVLALVAGLAARSVLGVVWAFGAGDGGPAFYWLNLLVYTPACLALLVADIGILRAGATRAWPRRTALIVPAGLAVALSVLAYGYQPAERPRSDPSPYSSYVETPVARFHYLRRGTGSPVVLLSPGAAPASGWRPQLQALSRRHTVYVVDLPGQGHTEVHDEGFGYDLDAMTTALGYAQRHPERVSRLMLLASSGLAERDPWSWEVLKLPVAGEVLAKLGTTRAAVESALRGLFVHQDRVTAELVDQMWTAATFADNVRSLYALERGLDWRITSPSCRRKQRSTYWPAAGTRSPSTARTG